MIIWSAKKEQKNEENDSITKMTLELRQDGNHIRPWPRQCNKRLSFSHCHTKRRPHVYISFTNLLPFKTLNQSSNSKRHCPHSKSSSRTSSPPNSKREEARVDLMGIA